MQDEHTPLIPKAQAFTRKSFPIKLSRFTYFSALSLHSHEFNELVIVRRGFAIQDSKEQSFDIMPGDVIFIPAGVPHGYRVTKPELELCNVMWLPGKLKLSPVFSVLSGGMRIFSALNGDNEKTASATRFRLGMDGLFIFNKITDELDEELSSTKEASGGMAVSLLFKVLATVVRMADEAEIPDGLPHVSGVDRVISFLDAAYAREDISLDEMLSKAKMSKSSFIKAFKDATWLTPFEYLVRLRLAHAARLLVSSRESVGEVAVKNGFSSGNYLARQFKKVYGFSPTEYRNRQSGKSFEASLSKTAIRPLGNPLYFPPPFARGQS